MASLFLSRKQAMEMAEDLEEYAGLFDSGNRDLFKGFEIRFGDPLSTELHPEMDIEIRPIPEFLLIGGDED
jgi:hypothetical protein